MRDEMAMSLCCADCMGDVAIMKLEIDLRTSDRDPRRCEMCGDVMSVLIENVMRARAVYVRRGVWMSNNTVSIRFLPMSVGC